MKPKLLYVAFFFFGIITSFKTQNLVPNASFEIQDTCPAVSQIHLAPPWITASLNTPDLYNSTCSTQNPLARTGIGSSGVFVYNTFANNREYMEAPLTSPLIAGQTYCVSFYVKRTNYRYACNRIGAYFSTSSIYQTTTGVFSFVPQVQNNIANVLTSSTNWTLISGSFIASGGENNILIGNFSNDANTDTVVVNPTSTSKVCYYRIDDISVTLCSVGMEDESSVVDIDVFPNPASDKINVRIPLSTEVKSIFIYNNIGQEIKKIESINNESGIIALDNLNLEDGLYSATILTSTGVVNKKFVVQK